MAGQRTVRLLRNHIYPTYQLYAVMANPKTTPQDGLRLGALVVMEWLRQRLGENVPQELVHIPQAAQYREVGDESLPSLHINHGFVIDIVSIPEEGVWSLQITEPDLGSDPGNPEQLREAMAGRIIETNVGFKVKGLQLECGFQTVISDPDSTSEQADVYRLAFVHQLIQHPDFGLRHIVPLDYHAATVKTKSQFDAMLELWRDRDNQLPCVIFTQSEAPRPVVIQPVWTPSATSSITRLPPPIPQQSPVQKAACPYDADAFAGHSITFCHTFVVDNSMLEKLPGKIHITPKPGDTVLLEPRKFGGQSLLFPFQPSPSQRESLIAQLRHQVCTYPRGKEVSFGGITFLSAARENLLYSIESAMQQAKVVSEEWRQNLEQLKLQWQDELKRKDHAEQALREQLRRQEAYTERVEQEKNQMRAAHEEELDRMQVLIREREEEVAYLRRKLSQPREHSAIADWAAANFPQRLLLHPKAVRCLESRDARIVDIGLICDALDFLATDYWERRYRRISDEEMFTRCSKKYGRPFDVTPVGNTTIANFPIQYKIKYFTGAAGKPVESPLNYHLRVGNDVENLLRIYFLHDDGKQLVVIGSLPKHLQTVTISG